MQRIILFCLLAFLHSSQLLAQEEKEDSVMQERKGVMSTLTDGIVTGV